MTCLKCEQLMELYERTPKEPRDYWLMTELFVLLHGSDVCKDAFPAKEVACKACGNRWPKSQYEEMRPVDSSVGWCLSCGEEGEVMPIDVVDKMDADLKQAILECLHDYYNIIYDGSMPPMWVTVMVEMYCQDDGIDDLYDVEAHMDSELMKYSNDLKRINKEA